MKKYVIRHNEAGLLVGGIGKYFVDFEKEPSKAMTFSSKRAAMNTAAHLNSLTIANGAEKAFYSVCETPTYSKPKFKRK